MPATRGSGAGGPGASPARGTARARGGYSGLHSITHSRADRQIIIKLGIDATSESRAAEVVQILETDIEIQTLWYMANRTSRRAAVNDRGPVHVRTSMHHRDRLLRLLIEAGVQPNTITDHGMSEDDARVVVLLGVALHDVGMSIHRDRHELLECADRARLAASETAARSTPSRSSR